VSLFNIRLRRIISTSIFIYPRRLIHSIYIRKLEEENVDFKTIKSDTLKPIPAQNTLGFGRFFTDHMFVMEYSKEKGWHNARIEPYKPFQLDPATIFLHYGQGVFEGMKAYKTKSGAIQFFRPLDNFKRMNRSCEILCMPSYDNDFALQMLKELVKTEKRWIPDAPGTSLYIRPTIIAADPVLGVKVSTTYIFFIILSPVGAYYPEGFNPVKIKVIKDHVRAVVGGVGEAKTPANYAASLLAGEKAHQEGFTQVLWLDGIEHKYVEEVGAMNIFFLIDNELITPMLTGSILHGITRDSVLRLAKSWNMKVSERKISIQEIVAANKSGKLQEVFGCGTAAVISPVGKINYENQEMTIGDGKVGPLANKLYTSLTDIQFGRARDPFGWVVALE